MLICFDVGNTNVHGGFYLDDKFTQTFRFDTKVGWSADQLGMFLKSFSRENNIDLSLTKGIVVSSVVPSLEHHLSQMAQKYFNIKPLFVKPGVKTGIGIKYKAANEIGADLICSAAGAAERAPDKNLIIIDMGTATTVTAISAKKSFVSGLILPGPQAQAAVLASGTEKLCAIDITKPQSILATNTTESLQSGIYYAHLGGLRLMINNLARAAFGKLTEYKVIATGGTAPLFKDEGLFDIYDDELVLQGLVKIYALNQTTAEPNDKPIVA